MTTTNIAETLYLAAITPKGRLNGNFEIYENSAQALAAAALSDLVALERVTVVGKTVTVTDQTSTGQPHLDLIVQHCVANPHHQVAKVISKVAHIVTITLTNKLVADEVIDSDSSALLSRVLGPKVQLVNHAAARTARDAVTAAITNPEAAPAAIRRVVSLAAATSCTRQVLAGVAKAEWKPLARTWSDQDPIVAGAKKAATQSHVVLWGAASVVVVASS